MFVYRNKNLPPDPEYPADLKKLGYFITENDLIRQIADPEADFKYKINRNERFNVKHREAMNEAIRGIVMPRLKDAGLKTLRLPLREGNPPRDSFPNEAHVPIMFSLNLFKAPRIIVVFGEPIQDLGIWSYRSINQDGINIGSAVAFTKAVLGEGKGKVTIDKSENRTDTALILANTGQLLWHCATSRAITAQTWLANPRPAGNYGQANMSHRSMIPGNKDWREHIVHIFEHVLWKNLGPSTRVDVIGMSEGGLGAISYLNEQWEKWRPYISAICLADPLQSTKVELDMGKLADPTSFTAFMSSRCRAYVVSHDAADKPQVGYHHHGCNCYSSGEAQHSECILPNAWPRMLAWLDVLYKDRTYVEKVVKGTNMNEELQQTMEELTLQTGSEEPKVGLVAEEVTTNLSTQDDESKDGVELETNAEDAKQEKTVKWDDTKETPQDKVIEGKDASPTTKLDASSHFGDAEGMGNSYIKREASLSETDT